MGEYIMGISLHMLQSTQWFSLHTVVIMQNDMYQASNQHQLAKFVFYLELSVF